MEKGSTETHQEKKSMEKKAMDLGQAG